LILITGGAGFIGPKLAERLLKNGEPIRILDSFSTGNHSNLSALPGHVEIVEGDVRSASATRSAAKGCRIIYHLAAQSSVPASIENPRLDMETNIGGTLNVLEAARSNDSKVVLASSSVVYGNATRTPTPEDEPLVPYSFYGISKMVAENYCRLYSELFDVPTVVLRLFNVYGPGTNKGVMIDLYRKLLVNPKRLEILGTGKQTKDYLYIDDTVEAFLLAPERSKCEGNAYNIGLGQSYSVLELVEMMLSELELGDVAVAPKGGVAWAGDVELTKPDVSKAQQELGWKANTGIAEGLCMTLKWFQERLGIIDGAKKLS